MVPPGLQQQLLAQSIGLLSTVPQYGILLEVAILELKLIMVLLGLLR